MNNYCIKNVKYIDYRFDTIQGPVDIYIHKGRISFKNNKSVKYKKINANNYLLIPGFIQLHVHLCQFLYKGIAEDVSLFDWLQNYILPYEFSLTEEQLKLSSELALYELIDSGTTTFLDMGTFFNQEAIFSSIKKSKLTGFSGNVLMDRKIGKFANDLNSYIDYSEDLIKSFHRKNNNHYVLCPRFLPGITKKAIKRLLKLQEKYDLIIHTHASETYDEIEFSKKIFNKGNIQAMYELGMLSEKTIIAHAIHINNKEINILKKTKSNIAHCPSANMKLGSGIAKIDYMNNKGINIGIGSDGAPCNNNNNQLVEMRLAGLLQKVKYGSDKLKAKEIFKMATINGAKALGIDSITGSIEEGKHADLILIKNDSIHKSLFEINPFNSIVYSADRNDIDYVFSKGYLVKENGKVNILNKNDLMKKRKEYLKFLFPDRF